ncbi:unnamed protein product [Cunninghamella blakesleeana]
MKNFHLLFLFFFYYLPTYIHARAQTSPLLAACGSASESYLFDNCTKRAFFAPECLCNSLPWLGSLATCIDQYASPNTMKEKNGAWVNIPYYCGTSGEFLAHQLSFESVFSNATNYIVPAPINGKETNLHAPIRFNSTSVYPVIRTVKEFNNQLQSGLNYGGAGCVFVLGIMLLGMLNNFYHHYFDWRYHHHQQQQQQQNRKDIIIIKKPKPLPPSASWLKKLRRYIINPPFFFEGAHLEHARIFGFSVTYPSRLESIVIFLFVALNIALLFPNYDLFVENTYWPGDTSLQLLRYVADRTGEMSFALLPMVYLFGGRNNIMIWLTGWTYDRFIVAHKWVSRVMFLHAVIHSVAYTWFACRVGGWEMYKIYLQDIYFMWGLVATIFGGVILLLAYPALRRSCYDFFLYTHIVLVVIFTAGCWYHVYLLGDEENMAFLLASFAIWAYDRVARFIRVLYYNMMLATGNKALRKVRADIIPGTDCIRFIVDANKMGLSERAPGVFVYIYVPGVYFWQSHPFTISSWYQPLIDLPNSKLKPVYGTTTATATALVKKSKLTTSSSSTSSSSTSSSTSTSNNNNNNNNNNPSLLLSNVDTNPTFELLIRPQQGMTKKLYDTIQKRGPNGCDMYVLIEGPYGHTHPILQYDTAILVAGGVGTTATVPYLQEACYHANKIAVRHLVFIWVVQYEDQLKWSQQAIEDCIYHVNYDHHHQQQQQQQQKELNNDVNNIQSEKSSLTLDVSIYITRSSPPSNNNDNDNKKKDENQLSVSYSRPDLNKLVGNSIEMASGNSVAILQCGPVRMSDQLRQISANYGVPYFEEAFNW